MAEWREGDWTGCGTDIEGCIDGAWYGWCGHVECSGLCEYKGVCGCEGCDHPDCCNPPPRDTGAAP